MKNDTTILPFRQSETIVDPLTELAREGARHMLAEALKRFRAERNREGFPFYSKSDSLVAGGFGMSVSYSLEHHQPTQSRFGIPVMPEH